MINWLSKVTFYIGATIPLLVVLPLIFSQLMALNVEASPIGDTELILTTIPKLLLMISAIFLFRKNRNGLYILFLAFFTSIIHSVYVLGILEKGKRYIGEIQFMTSPYIYWIFKSFFYILPLILYLAWLIYWSKKLKHNKTNKKATLKRTAS